MPGKHVRFSGQTTLYSPQTSYAYHPPPLAHSLSTASSHSLPTPPVHPHPLPHVIELSLHPIHRPQHKSPVLPHPLPHVVELSLHPIHRPQSKSYPRPHRSTVHLHHLLQYSLDPPLVFDLRDSPAAIRARGRHLSGQLFSEPATSPPAPHMRIRSPHLPWLLRVTPTGYSQGSQTRFVTVGDVFNALYHELKTNTSPEEYALLGKDQKRAYQAYQDRYRRWQDPNKYREEKQGGIKRVDFLMSRVKFLGISPGRLEEGEWLLHSKD